MVCYNFLQLDFPLNWDDLGAIATALAVIVALWANHNSSKQLKKTLQMHEQMKNLDLLEQRVDFIEKIKSDAQVSDLMFQMLFNGEIKDLYRQYKVLSARVRKDNVDLDSYENLLWESYPNQETNAPATMIKNAWREYVLSQKALDGSEDREENYRKKKQEYEIICNEYELTVSGSDTESESETYNYKTIMDDLMTSEKQCEKTKEQLISAMTIFTQKSIEPLNKSLLEIFLDAISKWRKRKDNAR